MPVDTVASGPSREVIPVGDVTRDSGAFDRLLKDESEKQKRILGALADARSKLKDGDYGGAAAGLQAEYDSVIRQPTDVGVVFRYANTYATALREAARGSENPREYLDRMSQLGKDLFNKSKTESTDQVGAPLAVLGNHIQSVAAAAGNAHLVADQYADRACYDDGVFGVGHDNPRLHAAATGAAAYSATKLAERSGKVGEQYGLINNLYKDALESDADNAVLNHNYSVFLHKHGRTDMEKEMAKTLSSKAMYLVTASEPDRFYAPEVAKIMLAHNEALGGERREPTPPTIAPVPPLNPETVDPAEELRQDILDTARRNIERGRLPPEMNQGLSSDTFVTQIGVVRNPEGVVESFTDSPRPKRPVDFHSDVLTLRVKGDSFTVVDTGKLPKELQAELGRLGVPTEGGKPAEGTSEELYGGKKREYGIDDIRFLQKVLRGNMEAKGKFYLNWPQHMYEILNIGYTDEAAIPEEVRRRGDEPLTNPREVREMHYEMFKAFRRNLIRNRENIAKTNPDHLWAVDFMERLGEPRDADHMHSLLERRLSDIGKEIGADVPKDRHNHMFNSVLGVQYQVNKGDLSSFLHFSGNRQSGYAQPPLEQEMRIFLDPPRDAVAKLAKRFMELAQEQDLPYYFKIADFTLDSEPYKNMRYDRVIFYTSREHTKGTLGVIEQIRREHPDWFRNRQPAPMSCEISEGIGLADNQQDNSKAKFAESFTQIRAWMLMDALKGATAEVVNTPGLRSKLTSEVQDKLPEEVDVKPPKERTSGTISAKNMALVLTGMDPEDLAPVIQKHIKETAPEFGVHPDNLARDI